MMRRWLQLVWVLLLAGCVSTPSGVGVKESEGSTATARLVMLSAGYIDEAGRGNDPQVSRLEPWIEIDRNSGRARQMGVTLTRIIADSEIFRTKAPGWIAAAPRDELRITVGSKRVVLYALEEGKRWHKNRQDAAGFRNTTYFEQVRYGASEAEMTLLAAGPITHISASGQKGGSSWPRPEHQQLPEYQTRFSAFYNEQIKPLL